MKKLISLIGALIMSAVVFAQGTFSINEVKMTPGETKEVSLIMTATENIKGFQLDIYLPDGLSFVLNSKNKPVASLTDWGALHMLTSKIQSDGALRCVVVSMSGDIFEADDAPVINFEVAAAEDAPLGDCSILIKNAVLTPESGSKLKIEEIVNAAKIYKNLEVKVSAEANGTASGAGTFESGTEITLTATPNEGYHFVKWSDGSTQNPYTFVVNEAKELIASFEANKYEIVYTIDGAEFKKESILYGASITTPEAPAKEGYTFAGWGEVPATMPAKDLTLNGTYTVNKYNLIYTVDGTEYKKTEVEYGATITAEAAPEKEGHTFSGWSDIPATMPAQDVKVTGSFTANKYEIVYKVDGEVYHKDSIAYGEAIIIIDAPVKEGYIFGGWNEVPETMPAGDVEVWGDFEVDGIESIFTEKQKVDVYTLQGVKVHEQISADEIEEELPKGIYIIDGRKVIIR